MINKLKPIDFEILAELIKNPRLSDRQVAKKLHTSQPTITRRRRELEKERLLDYTANPDFKKLGYEILAVTFGKWNPQMIGDQKMEAAKTFLSKHPGMIFVSTGQGLGFDRVTISLHKNYSEYGLFMRELREEWEPFLGQPRSFLISLKSDNIPRDLTFKYLSELIGREHVEQKT